MNREMFHFQITELHHNVPKGDRIRRLVPVFEQGRVVLPRSLLKMLSDGTTADLVEVFRRQYSNYPIVRHDDFIDCLADIEDPEVMAAMTPPRAGVGGSVAGGGGDRAAQARRLGFGRR